MYWGAQTEKIRTFIRRSRTKEYLKIFTTVKLHNHKVSSKFEEDSNKKKRVPRNR